MTKPGKQSKKSTTKNTRSSKPPSAAARRASFQRAVLKAATKRSKLLQAVPPGVVGTDPTQGEDKYRDSAELYAVLAVDLRAWQVGQTTREPLVRDLHEGVFIHWEPAITTGLSDADKSQMADDVNAWLEANKKLIRAVQKQHSWPQEDYKVTPAWAAQMSRLMVLSENKPLAPYDLTVQFW